MSRIEFFKCSNGHEFGVFEGTEKFKCPVCGEVWYNVNVTFRADADLPDLLRKVVEALEAEGGDRE